MNAATESGRQYNPDIYMRTRFTRADFNGCCCVVSTMAKAEYTTHTPNDPPHGLVLPLYAQLCLQLARLNPKMGSCVIDFNDSFAFLGHPIAHAHDETGVYALCCAHGT